MQKSQPTGRIPGRPGYFAGATRSVNVLKKLGFDPITELVNRYKDLQKECEIHEQIRSGETVMISRTGKELRYDAEAHMAVYNLLIQIGDKLLRYGYGRVPENSTEGPQRSASLTINLQEKNAQFVINDEQPDYIEGEMEDE